MSNLDDLNNKSPELLDTAEWIEAMMKIDKSNMTIDEVIGLEMTLAREGSMLAVEETKTLETRLKEIKEAKERVDFELKEVQKIRERQILEKPAKKLLALNILNHEQVANIFELPIERVGQLAKELSQNKD